jgi:hypothetical protein
MRNTGHGLSCHQLQPAGCGLPVKDARRCVRLDGADTGAASLFVTEQTGGGTAAPVCIPDDRLEPGAGDTPDRELCRHRVRNGGNLSGTKFATRYTKADVELLACVDKSTVLKFTFLMTALCLPLATIDQAAALDEEMPKNLIGLKRGQQGQCRRSRPRNMAVNGCIIKHMCSECERLRGKCDSLAERVEKIRLAEEISRGWPASLQRTGEPASDVAGGEKSLAAQAA